MKKQNRIFFTKWQAAPFCRYYVIVHDLEDEEGKDFKEFGREKDIFITEIAVFCTVECNYR